VTGRGPSCGATAEGEDDEGEAIFAELRREACPESTSAESANDGADTSGNRSASGMAET